MKFFGFILLICNLSPFSISGQDTIFKKNGDIISVINLDPAGKYRSYRLPGEPDSIRHYISLYLLDSIHYASGHREVLAGGHPSIIGNAEEMGAAFKRNCLGIDVTALLLYSTLKIIYEYLPGKGRVGLTAYGAMDTGRPERYTYAVGNGQNDLKYNHMKFSTWHAGIGANFYVFPPGFFRAMAGVGYMTGEYREERLSYPTDGDGFAGGNFRHMPLSSLISSWMLCAEPVEDLLIKGGFEIPLYSNADFSLPCFTTTVNIRF